MFKRVRAGRLSSNRGFTLVEILIASAIMSIGILGFIEAFKFVTKVSSQMRARSLATNLAQEKIETLKNKSYYMLLLTTSPVTDTRVSPSVSYDDGNYAKESLSVGGLRFERAVRVDFASLAGGSISTMSYTSADPGLKRIVVYVFWYQGSSLKQVSLSNLKENPDVTPLNSSISGTITDGSAAIASMRVATLQNANFQAYTGSDGKYSFSVIAGSYTVSAVKAGYYTQYSSLLSVASGANVTQNFTVTTISSGTVISSGVYVSTQILISQVVASTTLPEGNVEYVELFNPTTTSVAIGASDIRLNYYGQTGQGQDEIPISITYRSTYVPSGGYYLIASTGILTTDGVSIDADAVYTSQGASYIRANKAGTIELQNASGTRRIDAVGWSNTSAFSIPQLYEETSGSLCQLGGAPGYVVTADGLAAGNQIVRMSSAGAVNSNYGNAYDTDDNYCNFYFNEGSGTYWLRSPRNKSTTKTMISGRPASTGSLDLAVSASDGLSTAETADNYTKTVTGGLYTKTCPDYGFTLSQVATGTWTVNVFAGSFTQEFTGVSVSASGTTVIPNASTTPAWSQSGAYVARLSTAATEGFIRGYVYDAVSLTALSGITVTAGGVSKTSGSNGYFSLTVTSGTQTATANPNNLSNPSYVSSVQDASVSTGGTSWLYFYLSKGGTFKGYVTSGSSPLPNITVVATKDNNQAGQGTSDSSGYFYIYDLSTGTFELTTIVDPSNTTSPATIDADIVASQTVSVGTFTVTGSYGTIQGSVTKGGAAITTGVLIVASTSSISVTPPAIYASSSAAKTVYYSVTSRSDGTYSLEVRGSSSLTYYMSAHYPTVGDTSTSTSRQTLSGISVTSGNTVTGKNFAF